MVRKDKRGLQEVTKGYRWLEDGTEWFQVVAKSYKGLQVVIGGY